MNPILLAHIRAIFAARRAAKLPVGYVLVRQEQPRKFDRDARTQENTERAFAELRTRPLPIL